MLKEFKNIILFVIVLFLSGGIGYSLIEDWNFLDSLYMTVITLSTTGFKEIAPLSTAGRIFTMLLIIFGISALFYVLGNLNVAIFEGQIFKGNKMRRSIGQLHGHFIVCGFGRMGHKIAAELERRGKNFVIIEKETDLLENCPYLYVQGDAAEDNSLHEAGIQKASGLVAVLSNDASNVFATLTARGLNPVLKIIARAEDENSRQKLIRAGADRVVLPYEIGGFRMTQALLKPVVVDYFDELFSRSEFGLEIEEVKIEEDSSLIDASIAESGVRNKFDIIIIGIYQATGEWIYNPGSETKLSLHDTLIVIGKNDELVKMQGIARHE